MYFANELEKLHYFSIFICISRKNVVYLHPQFHAGDVCASSAGVADIFKRRLLTLCSGDLKLRNFHLYAGLSNGRCPTGYRLSLMCLFWYRICVYAYAHTRTLTMWHGEYLYSAWTSALSVSYNGQCEGLKTWNDNSRTPRFFLYAYLPKQQSA